MWLNQAIALLDQSLNPLPQELNNLDWKEGLSPNNNKLSKHISAFANYPGGGFMVFGVENGTGILRGIDSGQAEAIVQKLSTIARNTLSPEARIDHAVDEYKGVPLLFIHIEESSTKPVHIKSIGLEEAFIRSGGSTQKASRQDLGSLMLNSKNPVFEELHVSKMISATEVFNLLDVRTIFDLFEKPIPKSSEEITKFLKEERFIKQVSDKGYYVTNLGALSAANSLKDFDSLARKVVRVIKYKGNNKVVTEQEFNGKRGYAIRFTELIGFISSMLPNSEIIENALRKKSAIYPEIALRELIANSLIHQDFSVKGAGPMIELFEDRMEISNPGRLLPSQRIERLIGTTPQSRNDVLASTFRRLNICEERGSGLQKSVQAVELYGLPPIKFEELTNSFKVTLFAPRTFAQLSPTERVEAAYQHAVLGYFSNQAMTNTSLRTRFKMHDKQRSQVSLVIKEAIQLNRIKRKDPNNSSTKFAEYVPYWA